MAYLMQGNSNMKVPYCKDDLRNEKDSEDPIQGMPLLGW